MKYLPYRIFGTCFWLLLTTVMVSDTIAENTFDTDSKVSAGKIHRNCKKYIFTVNAYMKPAQDISVTKSEKNNDTKFRRNVGTAIPVDNNGHLITMRSVVDDAEKVRVITSSGEKAEAHVLGSDYPSIIAVLKTDDQHVSILPKIISLNSIKSGSEVFFLGVVPGMSVDVNSGKIVSINPTDGTMVVSASGIPGTSGTPVFDKDENVIGLLAYKVDSDKVRGYSSSENTYLVISMEHAAVLACRIISYAKPGCGWLGVCIDFTSYGNNGILVSNVIKGSPADLSDIKPFDRIYEFNGIPVMTPHQFSQVFTKTTAGDTVSLKILRDGKDMTFNVLLTGH